MNIRRLRPHRPALPFLHRLRTWAAEPERGDVPGWVLITIMTAGLVAALWLVAEPLLTGMFADAIAEVGG
ncbi:hypothetical protein [Ornithinimicrobium tianjinense]|uniref:Uncharacterized protein n=1 Tax=Ornithinimicrobium tianjinense TaxID=1195761 RepID=A0A917BMR8_9MICO|nr:hypothetical protein [Ornithinimicrobium tianjinense]GGF50928.1 hypothetical protein GCM10011366_18450 [Ornithinimicrobium tianjinense]